MASWNLPGQAKACLPFDKYQKETPISRIPILKPSLRMVSFRTVQLEQQDRATKLTDPYYLTPEHRAWSKAVLCDARGQCQRCGCTGKRLYADHIREIKDGGLKYSISNGQALCGSCHTIKTMKEKIKRNGLSIDMGGSS